MTLYYLFLHLIMVDILEPDTIDATAPTTKLVAPTDSAKSAVTHYASEFLSQFGDIAVSASPEPGQTVVLYANNAQTVQESLRRYEGSPMILVMTRATRHEASTVLQGRNDVTVETVSE